LVVDGDGAVVGSFDRSRLEEAHLWAHVRAVEPLTVLPIRIEDLRLRLTWTVEPGACGLTTWATLPVASRLGVRCGRCGGWPDEGLGSETDTCRCWRCRMPMG